VPWLFRVVLGSITLRMGPCPVVEESMPFEARHRHLEDLEHV